MRRCAAPGVLAPMARSVARLRAPSMNLLMRNMTASTSPQAKLQARAPTSISRVSSRPPSATLIELVNVRTMMSPKRISDVRSTGSRSRCVKGVDLDSDLGRGRKLPATGIGSAEFQECRPEVVPSFRLRIGSGDRLRGDDGNQAPASGAPSVGVLDGGSLRVELKRSGVPLFGEELPRGRCSSAFDGRK